MYFASSLSIPLLVLFLRPLEEYSYPFSPHTLHLLQRLFSFQSSLLSMSINPLLIFTSSLSTALSQFIKQTHSLLVFADSFTDIRHQSELLLLLRNNPDIKSRFILMSNHPPLIVEARFFSYSFLFLESIYMSSESYAYYTNRFLSLLLLPQTKNIRSLDSMVQLKVVYSLGTEESFYSRHESTVLIDFSDCVLILPPFLTETTIHEGQSSDFCYGRNGKQHRVANWGDIHHELSYSHHQFHSTYHNMLTNNQWYYPYYLYSPDSKGLYHMIGLIRAGYISEYTVYEWIQSLAIPAERLAEVVSINQYYAAYLEKHLSIIYLVLLNRCNCHF